MQRFLIAVLQLLLAGTLIGVFSAQPAPAQPVQQGGVQRNAAGHGMHAGGVEPEHVLIILDASYSMSEPLQGKETKMAVAKRTILQVLQNVPPHVNVGLRVYGNSANSLTACRATDLLVPIGPNNRNLVSSKLIGVKPTGATPISHTLIKSVREDFANLPGKKSIILVSDGIETCGANPCDVAVNMVRNGVDIKMNVVGFGIHDMAANRQLKCIALSTFGKFYNANTAAELANSLNNSLSVQTEVQGQILLPDGTPQTPARP